MRIPCGVTMEMLLRESLVGLHDSSEDLIVIAVLRPSMFCCAVDHKPVQMSVVMATKHLSKFGITVFICWVFYFESKIVLKECMYSFN